MMLSHSFLGLVLASIARLTAGSPQGALTSGAGVFLATAAPDLSGSPTGSASAAAATGCNACYVIADVNALVWYSEVFAQTAATAMVSVGVGNGSRATSTSIVKALGPVSIAAGLGPGNAIIQTVSAADSITLNGAVLTSPTGYNVFTAYSVTSQVMSNGVCSTVSGSKMLLSSAYSETLTATDGKVYLDQNGEASFINYLGLSSCSGGGVNIAPTALAPVSQVTATTTQSFSSNSPLAALASSSSSSASKTSSSSSFMGASASAPVIVYGNTTITPAATPLPLNTVKIGSSTIVLGSLSTKLNYSSPSVIPIAFNGTTGAAAHGWYPSDAAFLATWVVGLVGIGLGAYVV